jgi:hypothetical protein
MKFTVIYRCLLFGCLSGGLLCSPIISAQEHATATPRTSAPTIEEAKAFLADAEAQLFDLGNKAQRAAWVQENFITDDTNQIAADAGEVVNTLTASSCRRKWRAKCCW